MMMESRLANSKRIALIKKSSNVKALEELVYEDSDFEIVKAARQRLKELPKSVKYLNKL
jgi:hypothetical protein